MTMRNFGFHGTSGNSTPPATEQRSSMDLQLRKWDLTLLVSWISLRIRHRRRRRTKHLAISKWLSQLGLPQYCTLLDEEYDGVEVGVHTHTHTPSRHLQCSNSQRAPDIPLLSDWWRGRMQYLSGTL